MRDFLIFLVACAVFFLFVYICDFAMARVENEFIFPVDYIKASPVMGVRVARGQAVLKKVGNKVNE